MVLILRANCLIEQDTLLLDTRQVLTPIATLGWRLKLDPNLFLVSRAKIMIFARLCVIQYSRGFWAVHISGA